jgi:hypothetical protein
VAASSDVSAAPTGVRDRGMLIGGTEVAALDGATLDVVDPAHGTVVARVAAAGAADVDRAVRVGREAFDDGVWSQAPPAERARVLHRFADRIEARIEDLYRLETVNNGRPIAETRAQIGRLPECDVTLPDSSVSRRHAKITRNGTGWTITDLGSTNGVKVNGRRIQGPQSLKPGDTIELGTARVTFELE